MNLLDTFSAVTTVMKAALELHRDRAIRNELDRRKNAMITQTIPTALDRIVTENIAKVRGDEDIDLIKGHVAELIQEHIEEATKSFLRHPVKTHSGLRVPASQIHKLQRTIQHSIAATWLTRRQLSCRLSAAISTKIQKFEEHALQRIGRAANVLNADQEVETQSSDSLFCQHLSKGILAKTNIAAHLDRYDNATRARRRALPDVIKAAIWHEIERANQDFLQRTIPQLKQKILDRFIEPIVVTKLFRRADSIKYYDLPGDYRNDDLNLEDQLFYDVELVLEERGEPYFRLADIKTSDGLVRGLRRWQPRPGWLEKRSMRKLRAAIEVPS